MRELTPTQLCGFANADKPKGEGHRMGLKMGIAIFATTILAGCVNVAAPEDPIVIELNINITAKVLLALADDADSTIEENADIF